jgi:hypothetical protein
MSSQDNYGYFGPEYSFADNIPLPGQIGVRQESSFGAIIDAVGGINYYVDTIAFGSPTFFDQQNPQAMGIRYFLNTEMRCSNGATMSEYFDGVTKGDLLGTNVEEALASSGLPGLKGLAPGILENARDALDPRPIFAAATGTGYPVCQKVVCSVGDVNGLIQNLEDPSKPYIIDPVQYSGPYPTQTRWVQAYDDNGYPINITKDEFGATPKCYNADGSYMDRPPDGCPATEPPPVVITGSEQYPLCTVIQPAVMPPSLQNQEGFQSRGSTDLEVVLIMTCVAGLGALTLWALTRKGN